MRTNTQQTQKSKKLINYAKTKQPTKIQNETSENDKAKIL